MHCGRRLYQESEGSPPGCRADPAPGHHAGETPPTLELARSTEEEKRSQLQRLSAGDETLLAALDALLFWTRGYMLLVVAEKARDDFGASSPSTRS